MRKRKEPIRSPRSISRLRACCAVQAPSGWAVTPRMCTCRVATSMTNKMYRRFEEDRVHGEEVAGQQSLHLSAQERPPGGAGVPRCRSGPPCAQDPPHGRLADVVAEPG